MDDDDEGTVQYQDPMRNFELQAQIDRFDASKAIIWTLEVEDDYRDQIKNKVMMKINTNSRRLKIPASQLYHLGEREATFTCEYMGVKSKKTIRLGPLPELYPAMHDDEAS